MFRRLISVAAIAVCLAAAKDKTPKKQQLSALDQFLAEAAAATPESTAGASGSLWTPGSNMLDLGTDLRARRLADAVTVIVLDRASAVAKGAVATSRTSNAKAGVSALAGIPSAVGALPNLVDMSSQRNLDGGGETSRETTLRTTLSARVTQVLPNGDLVIRGAKSVRVNSEAQTVAVRGIIRPVDISPGNTIYSDQLSFLEVSVDGKGVIGDAVQRPNFLYRLLLGLLPF